ncbi:hypothetical protein LCGC14_1704420 [marine sediment metagenome]|uniref:Uncharacterized protein n=1 Tax=marine sediment metagenome TaxID=412755 RepID=A0A0F9I4L3_9ZZZZ
MSLPSTIFAASELAVHKTLYTNDTDFGVGQKLEYADGRRFRYALAGELLVKAEILEGEETTTENDDTPAAAVVGDTIITMTFGSTAVADFFKGGYIYVNTTPGLGDSYKIDTHAAFSATSGQEVPLAGSETVTTALTTSSRVSLVRNPWAGLITLATAPLGWIAGVAVSAIPSAEWGWVQTGGPCAVMSGGTDGEGLAFAASDNTAGTGLVADADGEFVIGVVMQTPPGADQVELVFLTID